MNTYPATISVQELQRHYRQALDRTKASKKPLFILRNNKPEAVVVDMESWSTLVEQLATKELKSAMRAIGNYQKEQKTGKLTKLNKSLADLF
jgi:prevent-host-death family protein